MKILITNPPWRDETHFGVRSGARFPYMTDELTWEGVPTWIPFPFHPAIAAGLLREKGFQVEFWDGVAEGSTLEAFLDRVVAYQPDLYLQEVVAPSYPNDRMIFETLRQRLPQATLGAAGLMVTGWGPDMLKKNPAMDVGLTYEWEETALELAERLRDRIPLAGLKGIFHRREREVIAEPRRDSPELKNLPWPMRDHLPMLRYNDDFAYLPVPNLQMYSSRGCPYKCTFCVWLPARYGNFQVRFRDPDDIIDEMEWCLQRWPFKAVYFDDDTFNIKKSFVLKLCETMRRRNWKTPWAAMCRADLFDRETLQACRDAGLIAVKYGIESADQGILNGIKKNLSIEAAEKTIAMTMEMGIKVHLTLVVGLPGECERTLRKTWRFLRRTRPDYMQFSLATPYPGTELYREAAEKGWIEAVDWHEFNADSQAAMRTRDLTRGELEAWIRKLNLLRFGLQFVKNPWDCMRTYARKGLQSPRKLLNAWRFFTGLLNGKPGEP